MIALTVTLILDVSDSTAAADAANEILREQQRDFTESSCLLDYAVNLPVVNLSHPALSVGGYEEGDAFA